MEHGPVKSRPVHRAEYRAMAAHSELRTQLGDKESAAQVWCFAWTRLHCWKAKHCIMELHSFLDHKQFTKTGLGISTKFCSWFHSCLYLKAHFNDCAGISWTFLCPNTKSRPTPLCNLLQNPKSSIILLERAVRGKMIMLQNMNIYGGLTALFEDKE